MSGWAGRLWRRRESDVPIRGPIDPTAPAALACGWNGLPWGSSLVEFRDRFPHADKTDSGWWVTGDGPEEFCGITMTYTQYGFNRRQQLYMVVFIPEPHHRELLSPAALNMLGAPPGHGMGWKLGEVVVEVKVAGIAAVLTHQRYGRHT